MALVANLNSAAALRAKGQPLARETGSTILVVEDVEEIARHMEQALIRRNHKVICALNAEEAIQIAEHTLPKMILTDPDLPTLDRLLELVSEHRHLRDIPVVIIDIDEPQLSRGSIKVLRDFDALDKLVASL